MHWIARRWPTSVVVQFWGDLDRASWAKQASPTGPSRRHLPATWRSSQPAGPEPVIRLQAGGLKVASVLLTPPADRTAFDLEFLDEL